MKINARKFFSMCAERGYLLRDVATLTGVCYNTLRRIRNGEPVRLDTLRKIAKALNVSPEKLLEDE